MAEKPHILVLAYVYPPDAGSGTFRTLHFMNYLAEQGVRISLITVKLEDFNPEAVVDEQLVKKIHPSITVIRCSVNRPLNYLIRFKNKISRTTNAENGSDNDLTRPILANSSKVTTGIFGFLKDTVSGLFTCPDQNVGWIPDVLRHGKQLVQQGKVDCIFATGGPWSCVLAGALLHKITGVPLVLDFQDPWASNPNIDEKSYMFRYIVSKMEAYSVRHAATVIANTNESGIDFRKRYSFLNIGNSFSITNGFEKFDIPPSPHRKDCFSLVHTGELYLSRNPACLLEAVEDLIKDGAIDPTLFRLKLVGGISIKNSRLAELLQSRYLKNVIEISPRVAHKEAISIQLNADALLLIQPDFPLQIPGKLYEYIALQKPILAITEAHSATGNIIRDKSLGVVVENNAFAIKAVVLDMYRLWEQNLLLPLDLEKVAEFQYEVLAGRLEIIIKDVAGNSNCHAC